MSRKTFLLRSEQGQALIEWILSSLIITPFLVLGSMLLWRHWQRLQCAHGVFEVTRARLEGRRTPSVAIHVTVTESSYAVEGRARCGPAFEVVRLPFLENKGGLR